MKVKDIVFESGNFWIARQATCYTVFKSEITHSVSDCSYPKDVNGLSLAIAYCQYRSKQRMSSQECLDIAKKLHK